MIIQTTVVKYSSYCQICTDVVMNQLTSLYSASLQYTCVNILLSLWYEHIFDLLEKSKTLKIIQGHLQIFSKFKDYIFFSRTFQGLQGHVATLIKVQLTSMWLAKTTPCRGLHNFVNVKKFVNVNFVLLSTKFIQ